MEEKDGGTCDSDLQQRRVADDCPGNSDEVDAFFSLLSSTLHLPAAEPPPVEVKGDAKLASGRLAERIRALRLYVHCVVSIVCVNCVCCSGSAKLDWEYLLYSKSWISLAELTLKKLRYFNL